MGASTAGDGTGAMERAHGLSGDLALGERVELAPCRNRPIDAAALEGLYTSAGHAAGGEADLASLATGPAVAAWVGAELVGLARVIADRRQVAFIEQPVVHERCRPGGVGAALLRLLLAELGTVEEVYLVCDPGTTATFAAHGFRPSDRMLLRLDGARRGDQP